jgi:hypothetical protein
MEDFKRNDFKLVDGECGKGECYFSSGPPTYCCLPDECWVCKDAPNSRVYRRKEVAASSVEAD